MFLDELMRFRVFNYLTISMILSLNLLQDWIKECRETFEANEFLDF